jgi:hypothetical protein
LRRLNFSPCRPFSFCRRSNQSEFRRGDHVMIGFFFPNPAAFSLFAVIVAFLGAASKEFMKPQVCARHWLWGFLGSIVFALRTCEVCTRSLI